MYTHACTSCYVTLRIFINADIYERSQLKHTHTENSYAYCKNVTVTDCTYAKDCVQSFKRVRE